MTSTPDPVPDEGVDTGALDRSAEAIDEARGPVRDAMTSTGLADDLELPASGRDAEASDDEVTPRPS
jgi:hypothetical protein